MSRSARPGQKLADIYTAAWYRKQNKRKNQSPGKREPSADTPISFIVNLDPSDSSSTTKEQFDIVAITGPILETAASTPGDPATRQIRCKAKDAATSDNWAVLQGPLNNNTSPRAVVLGVTWANITIRTGGDTHVVVEDKELKGSGSGPALILAKPYVTGTPVYPYTGVGLILIRGGSGASDDYFKLLEDVTADEVWAERSNKNGDSLGSPFKLQNWQGIINGAQAGYTGQYSPIDGTMDFQQGNCITPCESAAALTVGTAPGGTVDEVYSGHTISSSGLDGGSLSVSGLPPGITADASGTLSGTPTEAGTFHLVYSATADKTGPGSPTPGSKCTLTRVLVVVIEEAE